MDLQTEIFIRKIISIDTTKFHLPKALVTTIGRHKILPSKGGHWSPMSGWWIIVSLQDASNPDRVYEPFPSLTKLAEWKAGAGGLDWLEELENRGSAEMVVDSDGYPNRYECRAENLPPLMQSTLRALSELDAMDEEAVWDLAVDTALVARQTPTSMLVVEVWDLS